MKNITIAFYDVSELKKLVKFKDSSKLLIQVFCANRDIEAIKKLQQYFQKNFPKAVLIGATTDGTIYQNEVYYKNKSIVTFTHFKETSLCSLIVEKSGSENQSFNLGKNLAKELVKKNTKVIIAFTDGITTNGEEFLNGINEVNNKAIVAGGMAGDNGELKKTYVFSKNFITENGAVGVSLNSNILDVKTNYNFDWFAIGKELKVTKSIKNRVYEIDGISAVDIYAKYLGDNVAKELPKIGIEFPLIFEKDGMMVGRAVLQKHEDNSLSFAGNIKEGTLVRFGIASIEDTEKNTQLNTKKIINSLNYKPEALFVYSCMAKRRFFGYFMQKELKILNSISNLSGFFTYGEFYTDKNRSELLNESATILMLSEEKEDKNYNLPSYYHNEEYKIKPIYVLTHLINTVSNELSTLNKYIYKQAYFDKLTKLPNRINLLNVIDKNIGKTIFLINIDNFTTINDFYGHLIGDELILKLSNILKDFTKKQNMELFKLPSDEFAIITNSEQSTNSIKITIQNLLNLIEENRFTINDNTIYISVTISAAKINEKGSGLANADMVLKTAKKSHKPYLIFDKDLQLSKKYEDDLKIANEIKWAISNNAIIPFYQPIFNAQNRKIEKYEALVRLRQRNGKILSPFHFLSISEKIKLYQKITEIMIEKTFTFFSKKKMNFSINLSFNDIFNKKTMKYLFEKIEKFQIAPYLTIEILETQENSNSQLVSDFTKKVYAKGAKIAIDDFGSGFANFQHMTEISSDYMKIDGSLIKNIDSDKNSKLIVETIIVFAKKLGKKTVAEFVHSKDIYDIVKELGVDYIQGYYLAEPSENI